MATQVSGASGWLTINGRPLSFREGDENEALNVREYSTSGIDVTSHAPRGLRILIDDVELQSAYAGFWQWKTEHFAGLYRVTVEAPGQSPQNTLVRVFPHKLTQQRYEQMQAELSAIALDLLFGLHSPASEKVEFAPRLEETSQLHDYRLLTQVCQQLGAVMAQIRREPHRGLREYSVEQTWEELSHCSDDLLPVPGECIALPPALASRQGITYLPTRWSVQHSTLTYDTYENRLLKHFLQRQLVAKFNTIQEHARSERQRLLPLHKRYGQKNKEYGETIDRLEHVLFMCEDMKQRCLRWSSEVFLRGVGAQEAGGKATQVLLKHPTYSRFYQLYLQFQQRLRTTHDTTHYVSLLALRKVSDLYEMWSVFLITRMAVEELQAAGYRMISNSTFYEVSRDYFQLDVKKNVASIVLERGDVRVGFKYEPIYPNQSTVSNRSALVATVMGNNPLTPDLAIEVYKGDEPQDVLIFDAKYRWERTHDGHYYPKQEDIDKMYRYESNIQYRRYQPGKGRNSYVLEDIVSSAYILYPGDTIRRESKNRIGALPLAPGQSSGSLDDVRERVKDVLLSSFNQTTTIFNQTTTI